ncbi:MAG: FKBP-type peptidyl-prolyl cis-trans isomerase [Sphingomicrobium sp.]
MSTVTAVPIQPIKRGSVAKLWLGIALLIAAALLLAWAGAGRMVGVTVKTVAEGKGPPIGVNDGVIIEYTGRLKDGKVFDTTEGRGPAPLLVGQVVPGFSSALQRMQSGGRYQVHIPSKLAYGDSQPPGSPIPPNSDLEFDIHVVQVVPNAALMAAQQAGQPQPR